MLPARPNPLVIAWFDRWCRRALRRQFHRIHLYPESPAAWGGAFDPGVPRLYVANHSSFWDGVLLNFLLRAHRRQPLYCMIDAVQLREHGFLRRLGGFSVDRTKPHDGMRAVEYAAGLLRAAPPGAVVVFPQGKIEANDGRPLRFESGVGRVVAAAPGVRVVPVALRYEFWFEQRAEAMVGFGAERRYEGVGRREIVGHLERAASESLDRLKAHGMSHRAGEFALLRGRRSISRWKEMFGNRAAATRHP